MNIFNRQYVFISVFAVISTVAFLPSSAIAQADPNARALAKAQYMLRQVTAEKNQLQAKVAELQAEIQAKDSALSKAKRGAEAKEVKLRNALSSWQEGYGSQREQLAKTLGELRLEQQKSLALSQNLVNQKENFDLCANNNKALYDINTEILSNYKRKGFWSVMKKSEPFTGFGKINVENYVQEKQYHVDDVSVEKASYDLKPVQAEVVTIAEQKVAQGKATQINEEKEENVSGVPISRSSSGAISSKQSYLPQASTLAAKQ